MGTMDSSAFGKKDRTDGSGKRDVWFNGPGDGKQHGHVVEKVDGAGNRTYPYVRVSRGTSTRTTGSLRGHAPIGNDRRATEAASVRGRRGSP